MGLDLILRVLARVWFYAYVSIATWSYSVGDSILSMVQVRGNALRVFFYLFMLTHHFVYTKKGDELTSEQDVARARAEYL